MTNSSNLNFYLARVEQARAEAETATLDHVRERCRRSEAAWSALADRAIRSDKLRTAEANRKAEEIAEKRHEKHIHENRQENP